MPAGTDYAPSTPPALSERLSLSASAVAAPLHRPTTPAGTTAEVEVGSQHELKPKKLLRRPKLSANSSSSRVTFKSKKNESGAGGVGDGHEEDGDTPGTRASHPNQRPGSESFSLDSGTNVLAATALHSSRRAVARPTALSRAIDAGSEADAVLKRAKDFAVPQYRTRSARTAQRREFLRKGQLVGEKLRREAGAGAPSGVTFDRWHTAVATERQPHTANKSIGAVGVPDSHGPDLPFVPDTVQENLDQYRPHAVSFIPPSIRPDHNVWPVSKERMQVKDGGTLGLPPLRGSTPGVTTTYGGMVVRNGISDLESRRSVSARAPSPNTVLEESPVTDADLALVPDLSTHPEFQPLRAPPAAWSANSIVGMLGEFVERVAGLTEEMIGYQEVLTGLIRDDKSGWEGGDKVLDYAGKESEEAGDKGVNAAIQSSDETAGGPQTMIQPDMIDTVGETRPLGDDVGASCNDGASHARRGATTTSAGPIPSSSQSPAEVLGMSLSASAPALFTNNDHVSEISKSVPIDPSATSLPVAPVLPRSAFVPNVSIPSHLAQPLSQLTTLLASSLDRAHHADRVAVARAVRKYGTAYLHTGIPVEREQIDVSCVRGWEAVAAAVGVRLVDVGDGWDTECLGGKEEQDNTKHTSSGSKEVRRADSKFRDEGWVMAPSRGASAEIIRLKDKGPPSTQWLRQDRGQWPSFVSIPFVKDSSVTPQPPTTLPALRALVHPPEVLFSSFSPGQHLSLPLRVVNTSPIPLTIHVRHVIPPTVDVPSRFRISSTSTSVSSSGATAPGMAAGFRIHFSPKHWRRVEERFIVLGWNASAAAGCEAGGRVSGPVVAESPLVVGGKNEAARLRIRGAEEVLDMGAVREELAGREQRRQWTIVNEGGTARVLVVREDTAMDNESLDQMFCGEPAECWDAEGKVQVGSFTLGLSTTHLAQESSCSLRVTYTPQILDGDSLSRDDVAPFKLLCCDGTAVSLRVRGRIERGRVEIEDVGGPESTVMLMRPWKGGGPNDKTFLLPLQRDENSVAAFLVLPPQNMGLVATVAVRLRNPSLLNLAFAWRLVPETLLARQRGGVMKDFDVCPMEGVLQALGSTTILFRYDPKTLGKATALWELHHGDKGKAPYRGLFVRIIAECVEPATEVTPANLRLERPLFVAETRKVVLFVRNSSVSPVSYAWSFLDVDEELVILSDRTGELTVNAGEESRIEVQLTGRAEGKLAGELVLVSQPPGPTIRVPLEAVVCASVNVQRRDRFSLSSSWVDFGMMAFGEQKSASLVLRCEKEDDVTTNSCQPVDVEIECFDDFVSSKQSAVLSARPSVATILPAGQLPIEITLQPERGSFNGLVVFRVRKHGSKSEIGSVANVSAQVETPVIVIPEEIDFGDVFTGVAKKHSMLVRNMSQLETQVHWRPNIVTSYDQLQILPTEVTLKPLESLKVDITWTCSSRYLEEHYVTLTCVVPGMIENEGHLQLTLKARVCGLAISCHTENGAEDITMHSWNGENSLSPATINFGTVPVLETRMKTIVMTNGTPIPARYRVSFDRYGPPDMTLARTSGSPMIPLKPKPTTKRALLRPSPVAEPLGFTSRVGNQFVSRLVAARRNDTQMRDMLHHGKGFTVSVADIEGEIPPHGVVRLLLTEYNNLPGSYSDVMMLDFVGWFTRRFRIEAIVRGVPLRILGDQLSTTPDGHVLKFGTCKKQCSQIPLPHDLDNNREITLTNLGPSEMTVAWRVAVGANETIPSDATTERAKSETLLLKNKEIPERDPEDEVIARNQSSIRVSECDGAMFLIKDHLSTIPPGQTRSLSIEAVPQHEGEHLQRLIGEVKYGQNIEGAPDMDFNSLEDRVVQIALFVRVK
ncbi:Deleted in lung and esophageal cancer protein 1 [Gonapodya sp. JEL0774]|nr:Deleted in lung and esophageal cancer protein 1 [Gonapodya sp. JEL0774]